MWKTLWLHKSITRQILNESTYNMQSKRWIWVNLKNVLGCLVPDIKQWGGYVMKLHAIFDLKIYILKQYENYIIRKVLF